MTRKKFVKLLMAKGYSRNDANSVAASVQERRLTYDAAYGIYCVFPDAAAMMQEAFEKLAKTVQKMVSAFFDAAAAFNDAFRESMEKD